MAYFETHIDSCHQTVHEHVVEAKKGVEAVQPCIATSLLRILVKKDQSKNTFSQRDISQCILKMISHSSILPKYLEIGAWTFQSVKQDSSFLS